MRTTVFLNDELIEEAKGLTGLKKTSQVLDAVLQEYVRGQNKIRLAKLCGSLEGRDASSPRRRTV